MVRYSVPARCLLVWDLSSWECVRVLRAGPVASLLIQVIHLHSLEEREEREKTISFPKAQL